MPENEGLSIRPRYELKYVAPLPAAESFLSRLSPDAEPDRHGRAGGYHVNSIYYDTTGLRFYLEKIDGTDPRYKVRIRYYGDREAEACRDGASAFLEIKHRRNQTISKDRLRVRSGIMGERSDTRRLFLDQDDVLEADSPEVVESMRRLLLRDFLLPVCSVSYFRRAFHFRVNPTLRVTVDTGLRTTPALSGCFIPAMDGSRFLPPGLAVVEVKFHWALPLWMGELLRELTLQARPYSKYCAALEHIHPESTLRSVGYQNAWVR